MKKKTKIMAGIMGFIGTFGFGVAAGITIKQAIDESEQNGKSLLERYDDASANMRNVMYELSSEGYQGYDITACGSNEYINYMVKSNRESSDSFYKDNNIDPNEGLVRRE